MNVKGILGYLAIAFGVAWGIWATLWIKGISATDPLFQWLSLPAAFAPALAVCFVRRWITREGFADIANLPDLHHFVVNYLRFAPTENWQYLLGLSGAWSH
jgi:uncharacterized membrane protein YcjF (UPF0283 family)